MGLVGEAAGDGGIAEAGVVGEGMAGTFELAPDDPLRQWHAHLVRGEKAQAWAGQAHRAGRARHRADARPVLAQQVQGIGQAWVEAVRGHQLEFQGCDYLIEVGRLAHAIDDVRADRCLAALVEQGFQCAAKRRVRVEVKEGNAVGVGQRAMVD
ncbi:hypothetical protein D3C79_859560 [compost metagenome]